MNKLDRDYLNLLREISEKGVEKKTRNGEVKSVFGRQIRHNMKDGFPLLTTKKMPFKVIVTELLWFLRGDTNIKYLVDNDCHIWDGDAYKNYCNNFKTIVGGEFKNLGIENSNNLDWVKSTPPLTQEEFIERIKTDDEFAKRWGDLGSIYGRQWRKWYYCTEPFSAPEGKDDIITKDEDIVFWREEKYIDQIQSLIYELRTNPDSRRLMVSAWNVGELDRMVLPPCHYGFQVYTRELSDKERKNLYDKSSYIKDIFPTDENGWNKLFDGYNIPKRAISLMWNQRSVDVPLGLPFNISSYGLLLEILGRMVNMVPEELIANLGDTHIYSNQMDGVNEQLSRKPFHLPGLRISDEVTFEGTIDDFLSSCNKDSFIIKNYESHPSIKMPLSN